MKEGEGRVVEGAPGRGGGECEKGNVACLVAEEMGER